MITGQTILSPAHFTSALFSCARTPARWQQVTNEAAWRINQLRRGTAWVTFLEGFSPGLLAGPLWGDGLEAATRGSSRPPAGAAPAPRSARKRAEPVAAIAVPKRAEVRSASPGTIAQRPSAECLRLPSQADGELLRHWAEHRRSSFTGRKKLEAHNGTSSGAVNLPAGPTVDANRSHGAPRPASEAGSALADLLSRRVARTMSRFAHSSAPADSGASAWIDQWSGLLEGPAATLELLNAAPAVRPGIAVSKLRNAAEGPTQASSRGPRPEPVATSQAAQSAAGPAQIPSEDISGVSEASEAFKFTPPFRVPRLVAAPTALQQPLLPLTGGGSVEAARDWDLEALSAGIKQILDAEARRHGIDV
jgi:hypothetical protein